MEDTGPTGGVVGNDLKSQRRLAFFDEIRVDHVFEFLGTCNGAKVTVHICILDRELVIELECILELYELHEQEKLERLWKK